MTNQATIGVLESRPVPPDLQCDLPQRTADAIAKVMRIAGLASQVASPTGVTPVTNNIGQQALQLAQELQETVRTLTANQVQRRVVALRANIPSGDSVQSFVISPVMPSENYEVRLTYFGAATHPSAHYGWRVVAGSQSQNGFQITFDNVPVGTQATVIVEELKSVEL